MRRSFLIRRSWLMAILAPLLLVAVSPSVNAAASYVWTQQSPATSPPARYGASMSYDASTSEVVLFGGYDTSNVLLNDTWLYNGSSWTQVIGAAGCTTACASSPPARAFASMSYDASTSEVVLFGGWTGSSYLNDTWVYNGSSWTQVIGTSGCTTACSSSPPGRESATMSYDVSTSQVVLFGGYNGSSYLNDTWVYNGSSWTQVIGAAGCGASTDVCASSPPARDSATMSYDASTSQVVLFGGYNGSSFYNDTWVYNGSSWAQVTGTSGCTTACAGSPPGLQSATMSYDTATSEAVLFGGYNGSSYLNDTWTLYPAQIIPATLGITAGTLAFVSTPASFSFTSITLNGATQTTTASVPLDIGDATGSGNGWNVTLSATTFTNASGNTLADGDFSVLSTSLPTVACDTNSTCTAATLANLYPYTLSGTATKLLSSAAGTGMGDQTVTIPWSGSIPANAYAGTYTSTWTFTLVSGP